MGTVLKPLGKMKTDSLILLNIRRKRMSATVAGGPALGDSNRLCWRELIAIFFLIFSWFYMENPGSNSSGLLQMIFCFTSWFHSTTLSELGLFIYGCIKQNSQMPLHVHLAQAMCPLCIPSSCSLWGWHLIGDKYIYKAQVLSIQMLLNL